MKRRRYHDNVVTSSAPLKGRLPERLRGNKELDRSPGVCANSSAAFRRRFPWRTRHGDCRDEDTNFIYWIVDYEIMVMVKSLVKFIVVVIFKMLVKIIFKFRVIFMVMGMVSVKVAVMEIVAMTPILYTGALNPESRSWSGSRVWSMSRSWSWSISGSGSDSWSWSDSWSRSLPWSRSWRGSL